MKFVVTRVSDYVNEDDSINSVFIDINTLEELIEFYKKHGKIIIGENLFHKENMELIIYDDYIE
jgi:hypothetical protein